MPLPLFLERTLPRSIDIVSDMLTIDNDRSKDRAQTIDIWLFDDTATRRSLEKRLAAEGITVRVRSSYKPLVHFFLEEVETEGLSRVPITYPTYEALSGQRFLLEAYPLAALLKEADIQFTPQPQEVGTQPCYLVHLVWQNGREENHTVAAPNKIHKDCIGASCLSPTGWIRWESGREQTFETDYEQLFSAAMQAIMDHDWGEEEPYFEELNITIQHPAEDEWLSLEPVDALISLREALHEDLYFSLLEVFQQKSGLPIGDRSLMPGQIVPEIVKGTPNGPLSLRIETRALTADEEEAEDHAALATLPTPLTASQLRRELEMINGHSFSAQTPAGRKVHAHYHKGTERPVIISGGQHANEVTGPAGAIRAGLELTKRPNSHFTLSPLENPDGYQLDWRLRADNPHHMHHAARYTALGCDMEYRSLDDPLYETAIRVEVERLTDARLHINLHGYPAHEWSRPCTGYVPRGFEMWTLPKGFFLICRYHESWSEQAHTFIEQVTGKLSEDRELVAFNAQQIALYTAHAGKPEWPVINGFPVMMSINEDQRMPVTLITEYPDETIYGDDFIQGHTAQMRAAMAAYEVWQTIPFS